MNIRKVRKKCMMRGCKNTDTYAISKTREFGGVIICKECISSASNEIEVLEKPKKKADEKKKSGANDPKKDVKNDTGVVNQGEGEKEPSADAKTPAKPKNKAKTK